MYNLSLILLVSLVELEVIFIFIYLFPYFPSLYHDNILNLWYLK